MANTSKKKTTTKRSTSKKQTESQTNKRLLNKSSSASMHIFAGFVLGILVAMLYFAAYLIVYIM